MIMSVGTCGSMMVPVGNIRTHFIKTHTGCCRLKRPLSAANNKNSWTVSAQNSKIKQQQLGEQSRTIFPPTSILEMPFPLIEATACGIILDQDVSWKPKGGSTKALTYSNTAVNTFLNLNSLLRLSNMIRSILYRLTYVYRRELTFSIGLYCFLINTVLIKSIPPTTP